MPVLMTPYHMMNLRQHFTDDKSAYFVVLPRTAKDVSKAVLFAKTHQLALSVFGTGTAPIKITIRPRTKSFLIDGRA